MKNLTFSRLQAFGRLWTFLDAPGSFWKPLETSGSLWELLEGSRLQTLQKPMSGDSRPYKNHCLKNPDHTKTNVWRIQALQKPMCGASRPYKNQCLENPDPTKTIVWRIQALQKHSVWRCLEAPGRVSEGLGASIAGWRCLEASASVTRCLQGPKKRRARQKSRED